MSIVLEILATAQAVQKAGQRAFKRHGLTAAQFNVLNLLSLHPEGMRPSDLAGALVVDPSNVTGLIKRMTRDGYLQARDNPADGRQLIISLTPAGRRLWQKAEPDYEQGLRDLEANISTRDRAVVARVLAGITSAAASVP